MTRNNLINLIKYAGYHNDVSRGTRLFVENRISMSAYNKAFRDGIEMKRRNQACGCTECKGDNNG